VRRLRCSFRGRRPAFAPSSSTPLSMELATTGGLCGSARAAIRTLQGAPLDIARIQRTEIGDPQTAYGLKAGDRVLVRPDGYLGSSVGSEHLAQLEEYLPRVGLGGNSSEVSWNGLAWFLSNPSLTVAARHRGDDICNS
jgi:hypothetical protein